MFKIKDIGLVRMGFHGGGGVDEEPLEGSVFICPKEAMGDIVRQVVVAVVDNEHTIDATIIEVAEEIVKRWNAFECQDEDEAPAPAPTYVPLRAVANRAIGFLVSLQEDIQPLSPDRADVCYDLAMDLKMALWNDRKERDK